MDLTKRLRDRAAELGSAGFGVCGVEPFTDTAAEMRRRVEEGSHASLTFTYNDIEVAADIRRSFPWAVRLVVVAWPYLPAAGSPGSERPGTGRVARFATDDHYRGLRTILDAVAAELVGNGYRAHALSDDNRLVDRAAAVRAGVGWWGKNSMVLAPGHGPWLLLGSVVTDADLDPSSPMMRDCGSCTACLPACPTGALVAPGILDARKCLARWAQAPGIIPRPYRSAMGDRIYGCDDCLEACPPGDRLVRKSGAERGRVDLAALLAASDVDLLRRYGHFYLPRRQAAILRRNALVAMGNTGGDDADAILAGYVGHPDPMLRVHAAWALGVRASPGNRKVLAMAAGGERDGAVLAEIEHALR